MLTASAMVPELVISIKVMMAIKISGIGSPPKERANISLCAGHGSVVDNLTFRYPTKKQEKIKVSLTRKIHIMAFPQGT